MKLNDYFKVAFGNLVHRKVRSWLTLLGIFVGVAAIVALIALGQGLQTAVQEQFIGLGLNTLSMTGAGSSFGPPGTNAVGKLFDRDIDVLLELNDVDVAFGRYIKPTIIEYRGERANSFVVSIPSQTKDQEKVISILNYELEEGRLIKGDETDKVTIGANVKINDFYPGIGERIIIQEKKYQVVGILEKKGNPATDNAILMAEEEVQTLFAIEEDYSLIVIGLKDDADNAQVKEIAERAIRRDRGQKIGEEDFSISSPQDTLEAFNSILLAVQILLVGIAGISLLVGAIGILNTMYTAVLERRREIGIMKAIGAKNNYIQNIFLIESGLLGLTGGVIGLLLGIGIAKLVELIAYLSLGQTLIQATIPAWLIIGSLVFAFLIGALSGTLPAKQASKLHPVDALRK
jgi:putative ABC transport system permease protein